MTRDKENAMKVRCDQCGHEAADHGRDGCAADDEAAMGGCFCLRVGEPSPRPTVPFDRRQEVPFA